MTITLRVEKGAPLTIAELDGNFEDLDGRVVVLEGTVISVRSIEEIVQVGNSLIVQYTDSTEDGPFTFEVHITFRGDWEPATNYALNDLIHAEGVIYIVTFAHLSEATFDPGANDGTGADYYTPFLSMPELQLPIGGGEGYVLSKASGDDYDTEWRNSAVPTGGTTGQFLIKVSDDDHDTEWAAATVSTVFEISATTFTISSPGYASAYFRTTHASGCTITIPLDTDVEFDIGAEIHFRQSSIGPIIFVGDSSTAEGDVTINGISGYENATDLMGSVVTIKKVGTNSWDLWGLVTSSTA